MSAQDGCYGVFGDPLECVTCSGVRIIQSITAQITLNTPLQVQMPRLKTNLSQSLYILLAIFTSRS